MDSSGVEIGAVLAGRYRIERVLAKGGMGVVVQATHLQLQQPVAVKVLLPEMMEDKPVVQRFLREAQATVRLKSEHVARVIDVGSLETGVPYMVLEYLEGADLSQFPRSQLTVGVIVDLMLQACEALAEAHALGIVHRDVKPGNFFITRRTDGALLLKVLDFGISKLPAASGPLTATQTVIGTPAYMSPEQMRSARDVDHRSDIWSLGVVLYELLQDSLPFGNDPFLAMAIKIVNDPVPKLTVRLPGELDEVVYRCLEKSRSKRFQGIAELAQALSRYAGSETQAAISVERTRNIAATATPRIAIEPSSVERSHPSTISGSVTARTVPLRKRRRPSRATLGALIGVTALVVAGWQLAGSTEPALSHDRTDGTATVRDGRDTSDGSRSLHSTTRPVPEPPPAVTAPVSPSPPVVTEPAPPSSPVVPALAPVPPRGTRAPAAPMSKQPALSATPPTTTSRRSAVVSPKARSESAKPLAKKPEKRPPGAVEHAAPEVTPLKEPVDDRVLERRR